jgi:hypothetical protein
MSDKVQYLKKFVKKTNTDRFFVGWSLAQYRAFHGLEEQSLAQFLECDLEHISRLSMCRQPNDQEEQFQEQVRHIAEFSACNADRLVQLMREVATFSALQEGVEAGQGAMLMAARDRKEEDETPDEREEDKA